MIILRIYIDSLNCIFMLYFSFKKLYNRKKVCTERVRNYFYKLTGEHGTPRSSLACCLSLYGQIPFLLPQIGVHLFFLHRPTHKLAVLSKIIDTTNKQHNNHQRQHALKYSLTSNFDLVQYETVWFINKLSVILFYYLIKSNIFSIINMIKMEIVIKK